MVRDLLLNGPLEYGELLEMEAGEMISTNVLADRLNKLTEEGVLRKEPHSTNRKKYVYSLTTKGMALKPLLAEMAEWGLEHLDGTKPHSTKGHLLKKG